MSVAHDRDSGHGAADRQHHRAPRSRPRLSLGLVAELAGRGLKVDYHSVWDFLHAEKLSFKKRGGWRTRSPQGCAAALHHDPDRCATVI